MHVTGGDMHVTRTPGGWPAQHSLLSRQIAPLDELGAYRSQSIEKRTHTVVYGIQNSQRLTGPPDNSPTLHMRASHFGTLGIARTSTGYR